MRFLSQMGGIAMGSPAPAATAATRSVAAVDLKGDHSATSSLGMQLALGGHLGVR